MTDMKPRIHKHMEECSAGTDHECIRELESKIERMKVAIRDHMTSTGEEETPALEFALKGDGRRRRAGG